MKFVMKYIIPSGVNYTSLLQGILNERPIAWECVRIDCTECIFEEATDISWTCPRLGLPVTASAIERLVEYNVITKAEGLDLLLLERE